LSFNPRDKLSDTRRDYRIGLQAVIPMPNRPVAMPKKEVAVQVCSDDAHLLAAPPRRFKRPPIGGANQACNRERPFTVAKPPVRESADGGFYWVWLLHINDRGQAGRAKRLDMEQRRNPGLACSQLCAPDMGVN
jgi:hypothetical protein